MADITYNTYGGDQKQPHPQHPRRPQRKAATMETAQADMRPGLKINEERIMDTNDALEQREEAEERRGRRQSRSSRRPTLAISDSLSSDTWSKLAMTTSPYRVGKLEGGSSLESRGVSHRSMESTSSSSSCQPSRVESGRCQISKEWLTSSRRRPRSFRMEIGFSNIAEQVQRKSVKKGFEFTLMVAGDSGLGKSTLVNALFLTDLYLDRQLPDVSQRVSKTTEITKTAMDIEERGVKLRLTVVDTPGFGDSLDGHSGWKTCVKYVDDQFDDFFRGERGLHRKNLVDSRVHCCLYFIPPYGRGLRPIDLEFLRRMQFKVNLVPVIAKADCLTPSEVRGLKSRILAQLEEHDIEVYQFPECDSDEDDDFKRENECLKASMPFAIISGNESREVNGRLQRGRQLPWGFVEVDNPQHSDFDLLKKFLIQTHMQDLKDVTHDVHYENYRVRRLSSEGSAASTASRDIVDLPNMATDELIKEKDEEIRRMQEMMSQMQAKLRAQ